MTIRVRLQGNGSRICGRYEVKDGKGSGHYIGQKSVATMVLLAAVQWLAYDKEKI